MWKEKFLFEERRMNVALNLCEALDMLVNFDCVAV